MLRLFISLFLVKLPVQMIDSKEILFKSQSEREYNHGNYRRTTTTSNARRS